MLHMFVIVHSLGGFILCCTTYNFFLDNKQVENINHQPFQCRLFLKTLSFRKLLHVKYLKTQKSQPKKKFFHREFSRHFEKIVYLLWNLAYNAADDFTMHL